MRRNNIVNVVPTIFIMKTIVFSNQLALKLQC